MEKEYRYENAIVRVIIPEGYTGARVQKATEDFLRRVIEHKEKEKKNGNKNKSRVIRQESLLD